VRNARWSPCLPPGPTPPAAGAIPLATWCPIVVDLQQHQLIGAHNLGDERVASINGRVRSRLRVNGWHATTRYARLVDRRCVLVCVAHPVDAQTRPISVPLIDATRSKRPRCALRSAGCAESTTYPCTTVAADGAAAGESGLAQAGTPHRVPHRSGWTPAGRTSRSQTPPMALGGLTERAPTRRALYVPGLATTSCVSRARCGGADQLLETSSLGEHRPRNELRC